MPMVRVSLVDGPFEAFPSFPDRAGLEIVPRDRKGCAQIHLAVRGNGKPIVATGAFDEFAGSRAGFFDRR
jgi:hypothetical protein